MLNWTIPDYRKVVEESSSKTYEGSTTFGEVFTPYSLVEKILDELPNSYFEDPTKTFFDPCAGKGNFQVVLVDKLLQGLKNIIQDEGERYRHILENQIFMAEVQKSSIETIQKAFNPNEEYNLNLFHGNSLKDNDPILDSRYDVILGNPPFNDITSTRSIVEGSDKRRSRGKALHLNFTNKFLDNANDYFFFIMPAKGWWLGKNHNKNKKHFTEKGLYKVFSTDGFFPIVLIRVCVFCFDKKTSRQLEDFFEEMNTPPTPVNNLSKLRVVSDTFPRRYWEHLVSKKEKENKIWITGTKVGYFDNDSKALDYISDSTRGNWRVVISNTTTPEYIANVFGIAKPSDYLSSSVVGLKVENEDQAKILIEYLNTPEIRNLVKKYKPSTTNSKYVFSFIENPFIH